MSSNTAMPENAHDLIMERTVDAPRELVWDAWTRPELLKQWFTPAPWKTLDAEIDLRPGGAFRTVMQSPEGQEFPNSNSFLEVVRHERLVWTSALQPGWRPAPKAETLGSISPASSPSRPREGPPGTGPRSCTGASRTGTCTRRWASTKAGARRGTSWWP